MTWQNNQVIIYILFYFILFSLGLTMQKRVQESITSQVSQVTRQEVTVSHYGSHDKCGKVVHRPCNSCISSVGKSNGDSIKFSLSIAEQRAVGFIPAWSLAFLQGCPLF